MTDNTVLPGTGESIADEDIGGVKYQKVLSGWGAAGAFQKTDIASGKAFPIQVRSATGLIPIGEPTGAKVITDADGTIQQYLRGLVSQWIAGTLTLGSVAHDVAVSLTRTNDTNPYAANDIIGSATGSTAGLTFASMGQSGKGIEIRSAELEIDASALISGETNYLLHLYNVTPPSASGDNAAFDLPSGDRASYLGSINLGTPVGLGSTLYVRSDGLSMQIKLSGTDLFAYLVTVGGYTPTASRVHKITLHSLEL